MGKWTGPLCAIKNSVDPNKPINPGVLGLYGNYAHNKTPQVTTGPAVLSS